MFPCLSHPCAMSLLHCFTCTLALTPVKPDKSYDRGGTRPASLNSCHAHHILLPHCGGGNGAALHGLLDVIHAGRLASPPTMTRVLRFTLSAALTSIDNLLGLNPRAAPRRRGGDSMPSSAALASAIVRLQPAPVPLQLSDRATMQCTAAAARAQVAGSAASQHRTGSSLRQAVPQRHQQQRGARQMSVQATAAPEKPQLQRPDSTGA